MDYFCAKNDHELGCCLRMLYSEGISTSYVLPVLNERKKTEYRIRIEETERFEELNRKYQCLR